jgi:dephospho-CoA kinase
VEKLRIVDVLTIKPSKTKKEKAADYKKGVAHGQNFNPSYKRKPAPTIKIKIFTFLSQGKFTINSNSLKIGVNLFLIDTTAEFQHMAIKKIGITGGIGSGKTTVCKIFEALGIPVYYADEKAKKLMVEDEELIQSIISAFGEDAYIDGILNRPYLANLVFKDNKLLEQLNGIVHPALGKDYEKWHKAQEAVPYTLEEAAILFEMGGHEKVDKVIVVSAPLDLRIKRVMERDGVERQNVLDRVSKQMPEEEKIKRADFVIKNDGNHSLIEQIIDIHRTLKS